LLLLLFIFFIIIIIIIRLEWQDTCDRWDLLDETMAGARAEDMAASGAENMRTLAHSKMMLHVSE
jgi:hypothetical protein